jgi:hypothetical protein
MNELHRNAEACSDCQHRFGKLLPPVEEAMQTAAPAAKERHIADKASRVPAPLRVVPNSWLDKVSSDRRPAELDELGTVRLQVQTRYRRDFRINRGGVIALSCVVGYWLLIALMILAMPAPKQGPGEILLPLGMHFGMMFLILAGVFIALQWPRHFGFVGCEHGFLWRAGQRSYLLWWDDVEGLVGDVEQLEGLGGSRQYPGPNGASPSSCAAAPSCAYLLSPTALRT